MRKYCIKCHTHNNFKSKDQPYCDKCMTELYIDRKREGGIDKDKNK